MTFDVCVFGAGPAGVATALRLAAHGITVILLDRPAAGPAWVGETVAGAIREPLAALGMWEEFQAAGHAPSFEIRAAWGTPEARATSSVFRPHGHARHIDRALFDAQLHRTALARGGTLRAYRALRALRRHADGWEVRVDADAPVHARFLVDATGRRCALGRRLGVRRRHLDRLVAVISRVPRHADPSYGHALLVEACAAGWWYAAPVPDGHVLAFLTDHDLLMASRPRGRLRIVAAHSVVVDSPLPLDWLPVGDACAAHDPLFGWGVIRALANGILAADAIADHLGAGDASAIERYRIHCAAEFARYREGLEQWYARETRWPASPFWARRAGPLAAAG